MAKVNKWIKVGTGHYEFMHDRSISIKKIPEAWNEDLDAMLSGDKWEAAQRFEDGRIEYLDTSGTLYTLKNVVEMEYDERIKEEVTE